MPFFIEQQLARGFIGTEVKARQLLGHDVALQFRGPAGRRDSLAAAAALPQGAQHILAFNYSLYCPGDTRLATPLIRGAPAVDATS